MSTKLISTQPVGKVQLTMVKVLVLFAIAVGAFAYGGPGGGQEEIVQEFNYQGYVEPGVPFVVHQDFSAGAVGGFNRPEGFSEHEGFSGSASFGGFGGQQVSEQLNIYGHGDPEVSEGPMGPIRPPARPKSAVYRSNGAKAQKPTNRQGLPPATQIPPLPWAKPSRPGYQKPHGRGAYDTGYGRRAGYGGF